jgi:hypothetical protein
MIWDDMNETPENCPASFSRNFLRRMQDQERGDLVRRPANAGISQCEDGLVSQTSAKRGTRRTPAIPCEIVIVYANSSCSSPLLSLYRTALSGFS